MTTLTAKIRRAVAKYGIEVCKRAYHLNNDIGEGAMTVAVYCGLTTKNGAANTRAANAAIDAGRELREGNVAEKRIDAALVELAAVATYTDYKINYLRDDRLAPVTIASLVEALENGVDGVLVATHGIGGRMVGRVVVKAVR